MLKLDQFMNIRFLHNQGHSVREIARLTGHARNTVRKLLRATLTPVPPSRARVSKLDAYKPYLTERWQAHGLSAVRLLPEIRAQGFTGSAPIVRRFLHTLKAARHTDQSLTVSSARKGQVLTFNVLAFRTRRSAAVRSASLY
ncbi:MAG TPA: hypothetical protein VL069_07640 [Opitutus sp.]|nr:hypothetical protein [Opitutus sp.]